MNKKIILAFTFFLLLASAPLSSAYYGDDYKREDITRETYTRNGYTYYEKHLAREDGREYVTYRKITDNDGYGYGRNNRLHDYWSYGPSPRYSDTRYHLSYDYDDSFRRDYYGSQYHPYYYDDYNGYEPDDYFRGRWRYR